MISINLPPQGPLHPAPPALPRTARRRLSLDGSVRSGTLPPSASLEVRAGVVTRASTQQGFDTAASGVRASSRGATP